MVSPAKSSADTIPSSETLSALAAERVRKAILSGVLPPGSKLHIQNLASEFGFSATPMREALTRLISNGLVLTSGQKGFSVIPITLRDLEDIQRLRHIVEIEALTLSIANGDLTWESNIVSALHRLKGLRNDKSDIQREGNPQFDLAHKEFHTALLSACGSPRLLAIHSDLHDQVYRYRILLRMTRRRKDATDSDHEMLAKHVLARDIKTATKALHQHIDLTTHGVNMLPKKILHDAFADADHVANIALARLRSSQQ